MNLDHLHEAALHQLTSCRYAVLHALHAALCKFVPKTARGRPFKRTLWAQLVLTLIKLRLDLPYRTIEVMFRLDAVTAYRDVRRILSMLSALALKAPKGSALSGLQQGHAPMKVSVLARLAAKDTVGGIDIGPRNLAWITETEAGLFRFCAEVDRPHREITRLQRKIDRQRRANNPDNFLSDGRIRAGKKRWTASSRQRETESAPVVLERRRLAGEHTQPDTFARGLVHADRLRRGSIDDQHGLVSKRAGHDDVQRQRG